MDIADGEIDATACWSIRGPAVVPSSLAVAALATMVIRCGVMGPEREAAGRSDGSSSNHTNFYPAATPA